MGKTGTAEILVKESGGPLATKNPEGLIASFVTRIDTVLEEQAALAPVLTATVEEIDRLLDETNCLVDELRAAGISLNGLKRKLSPPIK